MKDQLVRRRPREHLAAVAKSTAVLVRHFSPPRCRESQSLGLAKRLNLHPLNIERAVDHFSGGNQQKVLLAEALSRDVKLFVFDEPTVASMSAARRHLQVDRRDCARPAPRSC